MTAWTRRDGQGWKKVVQADLAAVLPPIAVFGGEHVNADIHQ
jgi:hypothetical protein